MDSRTRRAWVEVDLDALVQNATAVQRHSGRPVLPMVKADAYGLGAVPVCRVLEPLDPWAYGVATLAEAEELRLAGITRRLLIFSPLLVEDYADARRLGLTPTLGAPESIRAWIDSGGGAWHLAIDTGMHRAGIEWWRMQDVRSLTGELPPEGAFTHLHSADTSPESLAVQQSRFLDAVGALPARPPILHAENSPAIERQGPSPWDVVRPGVFLYGVGGGAGSRLTPQPVAHLRARVLEVHDVRDGETVSYGATWKAIGRRRIATIGVGYADGYRRVFSSCGEAIVNGCRVPVAGRVTMDMTMLDVSDVPCAVGDVATLLGRADGEHLDINALCAAVDLLPYELLVGLKLRATRMYAGGPPQFDHSPTPGLERNHHVPAPNISSPSGG